MREILFRGIDKSSCKWVYGDLLQRDEGRKIKAIMPPYPAKKGIVVKEDSIGQYTGLTDKNGTKIFEGDIIRTKAFGKNIKTGVNCADYDIFQVTFKWSGFHLENNEREFSLSVTSKSYYEIIGNIHDNPELLKEAE